MVEQMSDGIKVILWHQSLLKCFNKIEREIGGKKCNYSWLV